jgi:hypothetical protein
MRKTSDRKNGDKYHDRKCYFSKKTKQSTSHSSSESDEHSKIRHSGSRAHKNQDRHSRSLVEKKPEAQCLGYNEKRRICEEDKRVAGETDRKRQRSFDYEYQEESQKTSCHSRDEADQSEFSFQRYCYELNVLLRDEDLIPDPEDFWKFLKNYETVQKRAGTRKRDVGPAGKKEFQKNKPHFSGRLINFYIMKYLTCECTFM